MAFPTGASTQTNRPCEAFWGTSFTPTSGAVGTSVTLTGTGFTGATSGKIAVTTAAGTGTSLGSFAVTGTGLAIGDPYQGGIVAHILQHDHPRHSGAGEPRMGRPAGARPVALAAGAAGGRARGDGDPGDSGAG